MWFRMERVMPYEPLSGRLFIIDDHPVLCNLPPPAISPTSDVPWSPIRDPHHKRTNVSEKPPSGARNMHPADCPKTQIPYITLPDGQKISMEAPVDARWRVAYSQPVPVLLRVTCCKGFWKGAMHYHHILPPPEGACRAWFDRERFLKKNTNPRGIVRIARRHLLSHRDLIDEDVSRLFGEVMTELKAIYDEDMVMTEDWVGLRNDSNGDIVSFLLLGGFLSARSLIREGR